MGPEIEFGMGKSVNGRPRPSLFVRLLEMAGLALVILGLGGGRYWLVLPGAALVVASYAIYRRKHGPMPRVVGGSDGFGGTGEGGD